MNDEPKKAREEPRTPADKQPERPKTARGDVDLFWLDDVFKSPADVFALKCPTPNELATKCVFALDTNALLGPFKVGADSVKNLEEIYNRLAQQERIVAPVQAVREYAKNRTRKVADVHDQVCKKLSNLPSISQLVCPMLEGNSAYEESNRLADELREKVKAYKDKLADLKAELTDWGWADRVSNLYRGVFTAPRIIDHDKSKEDIRADLTRRITHKIPPGYKDAGKPDEGVGDLLIWHALIKLAKDRGRPVVFVCNEEKADWLVRSNVETLMPRPELTAEFVAETGQHFAMMNWAKFLAVMDAKPTTVHEAELAQADNPYELLDLERRISNQLEIIADIFNEFRSEWAGEPEDTSYGGPEYIEDERLSRFVLTFSSLVIKYENIIGKPEGTTTLKKLAAVFGDIVTRNGLMMHKAIREKSTAEDRYKLFSDLNEFRSLHHNFNVWIKTNSVADDL